MVLRTKLWSSEGVLSGAGKQYEFDPGGGMNAVCRHPKDKNPYAQRCDKVLMLPERPDADNPKGALNRMGALGLKSVWASPQHAELLYLHRQAFLIKMVREPEYQHPEADTRASRGKAAPIQTMRYI